MAVLGLVLEDRTLKVWRRIVWFGGAVAGTALVMLGGLIYFNSALPNTYYTAKDLSFGRAFSYGLGYLISPIYGAAPATFPHALAAFVLVVELGFFALGVVGIVKLAPRCSYLAAIVVPEVLYILRSGGDWMPGGRFLAVGILPLTIVEILGLVFVASRLKFSLHPKSRQPVLIGIGSDLHHCGFFSPAHIGSGPCLVVGWRQRRSAHGYSARLRIRTAHCDQGKSSQGAQLPPRRATRCNERNRLSGIRPAGPSDPGYSRIDRQDDRDTHAIEGKIPVGCSRAQSTECQISRWARKSAPASGCNLLRSMLSQGGRD